MEPSTRGSGRKACTWVALCCLLWTLGTGVALGIKSTRPAFAVQALPLELLQPLHTLGVVCFLLSGIITLFSIALRRISAPNSVSPAWHAAALGVFFVSSAAAIITGRGSGLEYTSWPLPLGLLPLAVLALTGRDAWRNISRLTARSPEGAWLFLVGICLTPLGLVERVLGAGVDDASRALMIEWHALDTFFAGINTALYGLGTLLVARPGGRSLRKPLLFGVAAFVLVSTFGHHHYISAQPQTLKLIAFAASMLGMVSFVRHIIAVRRPGPAPGAPAAAPLIRTAAVWTLFAVGSGVIFAVPHINLLLHGTHAIVGHSMGAVIGVNVALVLGAMLGDTPWATSRCGSARTRRATRWFNLTLGLLVADLFAAGVAKGVMRVGGSHHDYQGVVRLILAPLPLLGAALACVIAWLILPLVLTRRAGPLPAAATDPHPWEPGAEPAPRDAEAQPV